VLNLAKVFVRPVIPLEEQRFQQLMQEHHYLGALPKTSETIWYVAIFGDQWVALLSFSAAALKCAARDRWIGWDFRHQYDRLKLITNNISIGTMMKTAVVYVLAMARKTLPDSAVLPLASSGLKVRAALHKKCGSPLATCAWSLTI